MAPTKPSSNRRVWIIFICIGLVAAVGIALRMHSAWALRQNTEQNAITAVTVIAPVRSPLIEDIVLPGNVEAWHQATIYARTSGYVKTWYTPMGTHVHEGQLLAEIETPEIDDQLRQAEADLKTAEANYDLAQITANRWAALLKTDSVSKQDVDDRVGDAKAKKAILDSAQANRDHLKQLASFEKVTAPFDGIITERLLDIGQLVNAGGSTGQPLFHIVQSDRLRVYVSVPQNDAARITPDVEASADLAEHPGEHYKLTFIKNAEGIDPPTRTLLIEFMIDNKDEKLFAGGYAEVHIKLPSDSQAFRLPVNTLIFRAEGLQVATVDAQGNAVLKSVVMGRDFGNTVEISSGISADDRVVVNPPDSLITGQKLRVIEPKKDEPKKDGKSS